MNQNKELSLQGKLKKRLIVGCVTILTLPLFLCGIWSFFPSWGWRFYPLIRPSIDRSDVHHVSSSFSYSLMLGDIEIAKSLTSEVQHGRLNTWFASHKTFWCRNYWLFTNMNFFEGIISGGGGYWEEDNLYEFSHEYQCYRLEMLVYLFSVDDVKIQKINNSWVVTDWKQICQRIENEPMKC